MTTTAVGPARTCRASTPTGPPPARRAPIRAALAQLAFRAGVRTLPVRIVLPGGQCWGAGGIESTTMYLTRPAEFFRRVGADANVGFGEAYQAGDWTSPALAALLVSAVSRAERAAGDDPARVIALALVDELDVAGEPGQVKTDVPRTDNVQLG